MSDRGTVSPHPVNALSLDQLDRVRADMSRALTDHLINEAVWLKPECAEASESFHAAVRVHDFGWERQP